MIFNLGAKEVLGVIESDSTKLIGSYESALKINEIRSGVMEQGENPSFTAPQDIKRTAISGIKTRDDSGNESVVTFTQPIELYGVDGKLDILSGKKIKRKFKKVVLNGGESWLASSFSKRYYIDGLNCKAFGVVFCSHAKGLNGEATDTDECYLSGSSNGLFVINTTFTTVTQFKAWLSSNPMTVIYELAEETVEELLTPDQIALSRIKTMNDMTYVEFITEVQPTLLRSEYATNAVGVVALNAWADNELGMARGLVNKAEDESQTFTVKIENGLVYLYKDDVLHGIVGANTVITNGNTYKTMNVRAEKDADFIALTNKDNSISYYMNINKIPMTANQYTEPHYFNGDMRLVGDLKATGGVWSDETHINKMGINGGAAQAVEWVWHAALGRWVLCSATAPISSE